MKVPYKLLTAAAVRANYGRPPAEEAPSPPKPATSIVGNVVVNLDRGLQNFYGQRNTLEIQLAEMTERLRQINAAIHVLELGITEIAEDPALTAEERETAMGWRPSIKGMTE